MNMKESYNPFKMWGSWIGLVLYPVLVIIGFTGMVGFPLYSFLSIPLYPFRFLIDLSGCLNEECLGIGIFFMTIGSLIMGFLVGWIIHSLFRKLKS